MAVRQSERENVTNGTLYWEIHFNTINEQRLLPEQYNEISRFIEVKIAEFNKLNNGRSTKENRNT